MLTIGANIDFGDVLESTGTVTFHYPKIKGQGALIITYAVMELCVI